jgi:phosphate transport system substrate-binding protein
LVEYQNLYSSSREEQQDKYMTRSICIILILVVVAAVASGCATSQKTPAENGTPAGSQKITVSGAFALYPMMVKWAEEYQIHKGVRAEVSAGGAGKGMTDALTGMVDLGMVSRDISPEEIGKGAVYVAVAKDAVVVTANADNPARPALMKQGINKSMLRQIFVNETVSDWDAVVHQSQPLGKINVYTRSDACGAADVWAKYLGGYAQENLKGTGVFGDPGLADAVKSDRLGIGYNNIGFAYDANTSQPLDGLVIIPLDLNDNGTIDPDEQVYATREEITSAIDTGKYPSPPARELNLVTKGNFSGPAREFVRWILTDGQQYVKESGYIPLTDEKIRQQLDKIS